MISWVVPYPTPDGKTHNQAFDDLTKLLLAQGYEKDVPYCVECEMYVSLPEMMPLQKVFHVILDSDRPASCFLVPDKDQSISITAEKSMMGFLSKLSKMFKTSPGKTGNIEVRGNTYLYRDFCVRAGILTYGGVVKGVILEAELRSCPILITAVELMKEFMSSFMSTPMDTVPHYIASKPNILGAMYSPLETIHQYYDIFSNVRAGRNPVSR